MRLIALILLFFWSADAGAQGPVKSSAAPASPSVGELAPDFTLTDQNGRTVTLSKLRGKKIVLVFYRAHW